MRLEAEPEDDPTETTDLVRIEQEIAKEIQRLYLLKGTLPLRAIHKECSAWWTTLGGYRCGVLPRLFGVGSKGAVARLCYPDDILQKVPNPEEDVGMADDLVAALDDAGIQVTSSPAVTDIERAATILVSGP